MLLSRTPPPQNGVCVYVVVCGSDLQRGHSGDGCLTSSTLFKYERSRGNLFVPSWARVRPFARGSVVSE